MKKRFGGMLFESCPNSVVGVGMGVRVSSQTLEGKYNLLGPWYYIQ